MGSSRTSFKSRRRSPATPNGTAIPDFLGGLVVWNSQSVQELSPGTGQPNPAYSFANSPINSSLLSLGVDGTIYTVDNNSLVAIKPTTGALNFSVPLDQGKNVFLNEGCPLSPRSSQNPVPPALYQTILAGDGNVYVLYSFENFNTVEANCLGDDSYSSDLHLRLLQVAPDGSSSATIDLGDWNNRTSSARGPGDEFSEQLIGFQSGTLPALSPSMLTNSNTGVLVSLGANFGSYCGYTSQWVPRPPNGVSDIYEGCVATTTTTMVLGDNNAAFITDGTIVESFKATTLAQNWAYTSTSGGNVSFVQATAGAGVSINDNSQGVIQFDSTGTPSTPVASLQSFTPLNLLTWAGISGGLADMIWNPNGANAIMSVRPRSPFFAFQGTFAANNQPPSCVILNCVLVPDPDPFDVDRDSNGNITGSATINYYVNSFIGGKLNEIKRRYEITLQEQLISGSPTPCTPPKPACTNDFNGIDTGLLQDVLAPFFFPRNTVRQFFYVDSTPVSIFWLRGKVYYGSKTQLASIQPRVAPEIAQEAVDYSQPGSR